jgi:hypothetical protein
MSARQGGEGQGRKSRLTENVSIHEAALNGRLDKPTVVVGGLVRLHNLDDSVVDLWERVKHGIEHVDVKDKLTFW